MVLQGLRTLHRVAGSGDVDSGGEEEAEGTGNSGELDTHPVTTCPLTVFLAILLPCILLLR
jgi:7,8-dihydropterin-6-yl-methyl-4-(beta-D-ribofuranosyl)aminobenzene 5'-phosphate synthase